MGGLFDALLERMLSLPPGVVRLILALAAALENIVPPIPADTVVLFGGFLAARSNSSIWLTFLATWTGNVTGALLVYALGRGYGERFFATRLGALLLQPRQLARLEEFYRRYGIPVIFISRFFPVFRALVPAFAGMSRLPVVPTALSIAAASGLWYGFVVYLGATAGRNWEALRATVETTGRWFAIPAAVLAIWFGWWWWRTRRREDPA